MEILQFIKDYWVQLVFLFTLILFIYNWIKATRCSLRNDILAIYDQCKGTKTITRYQKAAIHLSYDLYRKLRGNSFVQSIVNEIDTYEVID